MTEKENNIWKWESVAIKLTNPKGETVTLNSVWLNDYTLDCMMEDLQDYVVGLGGDLEWNLYFHGLKKLLKLITHRSWKIAQELAWAFF